MKMELIFGDFTFVWKEKISKKELFKNVDVTIIM